MSATAEQIAKLRRMVAEPSGSAIYTDDVLTEIIESHPIPDSNGSIPTIMDNFYGDTPVILVS